MNERPGQSPLFAEERREQILRMLNENAKILVQDLCEVFGVSPATIRSDLRVLERSGRLRRTHGGAIPLVKTGFEPTQERKLIEHMEEKQRIAQYAASLVEEGDIIALDSGTTTLELAKALGNIPRLVVITYDIAIASYLDAHSDVTVYLMGGMLRKGFKCTTGAMTVSSLKSLNVDKAFIATNAFSLEKGFTTPNSELAECKKAILSISGQNILLMDSSKVGRVSFLNFAEIRDVDMIITDTGISARTLDAIRETSSDVTVQTV